MRWTPYDVVAVFHVREEDRRFAEYARDRLTRRVPVCRLAR